MFSSGNSHDSEYNFSQTFYSKALRRHLACFGQTYVGEECQGVVGGTRLLFVFPPVDGAVEGLRPEVGVGTKGEPGLTFGTVGVRGLPTGATGAGGWWLGG